jgi:hypothetical protein
MRVSLRWDQYRAQAAGISNKNRALAGLRAALAQW